MRIGRFVVALGCLLPVACTGSAGPEPVRSAVTIDWAERAQGPISVGNGFTVEGCEGDAPFLCVIKGGEPVGQIEYFSFAAPAGNETIRGLIEDDYRSFESDRQSICPAEFEVKTVEPAEAEVSGRDGFRSEYSVADGNGKTVERYVKYWTSAGGQIHLLSAEAQEEGSCSPGEGTLFTDAVLTDFGEPFAAIAGGSVFPAPG